MSNIKEWLITQADLYKKTKQVPYILAIWFPYHNMAAVAIAYAIATGWSWWLPLTAVCGWVLLDGVGNNLTLHRFLSHRSWQPRKWMEPFLLWAAVMVGEGSPLWWAALHRGHHHKVSDITGKDIHTPVGNGWLHSYMGWQFGITQNSVSFRYAVDLLRDKRVVFCHEHYNKIIYATLLSSCLLFGLQFTVWFFVIGSLMSLHADGLVNTFGHVPAAGYRNFDIKDCSTNVPLIGYFHWGSGWHNNHHQRASSFDFGTSVSGRPHEFDPCMILMIPFASFAEIKRLWTLRKDAIMNKKELK
jgi:stearoyl-CoA desaturase (delta-9 desaturase)